MGHGLRRKAASSISDTSPSREAGVFAEAIEAFMNRLAESPRR
jgi:hypothetical protein